MRFPIFNLAVLYGALGMIAIGNEVVAQETRTSHMHMGHVSDRWNDTPEQVGLLPTAAAEAEIASRHAGLAIGMPDDLGSIKAHIGHVMHAIDPSAVESGPGMGYGVIKAAEGAATHIRLAANADDASSGVKAHATHVATSAGNVVEWARRILELGNEVQAAERAPAAAGLARQIQQLTENILAGHDADGDGRVSWESGEGGLEQAAFHMNLMKQGEGMD